MSITAETQSITAESATSARIGHLGYLDGFRGIAALYVVLHHTQFQVWPDVEKAVRPGGLLGAVTAPLLWGRYAVDLFIVLSGFCLMLPVLRHGYLRGGTRGFLMRRVRRILPPYYAAIALSMVLICTLIPLPTGTHWDNSVPVTRMGLFSHLLLVHDFFFPGKAAYSQINYTLWTVAVEFQIYLLFPLMLVLWKRVGGLTATLITVAFAYGCYAVMHFLPVKMMSLHYLALFAGGVLAAAITYGTEPRWVALRERINWLAVAALSFCAVAFLSYRSGWRNLNGLVTDPFVAMCSACLLIHAGSRPTSLIRRAMEWRPAVWLGMFSYSLYLIHAPLLQLLTQYLIRPLHPTPAMHFVALCTVGLALILATAYGFYLAFERPFLGKTRKAPAVVTSETAPQKELAVI